MSAMVATLYTASDPCRHPNSGATNHLTQDVSNLMARVEYDVYEKIHMGNNTSLSIMYVGNDISLSISRISHLPFTSPCNHKTLSLQ